MQIYVIRHGTPNYESGLLTEKGRLEAEKLGIRLKDLKINKIYISTVERAVETASYILKFHKEISPISAEWAREDLGAKYFFTEYKKGKKDWYFVRPEWLRKFRKEKLIKLGNSWTKDEEIKNTLMPEGYKIMAKSVDEFMLENGYKHDRKNHRYIKVGPSPEIVVIVAHAGFGASFISNLLDVPYPLFTSTHSPLTCTSISRIEVNGENAFAKLLTYNDISHLEK